MLNNLMVLDCTFRDGGYYNDWDFPESVVSSYFEAMVACGVDVVEIGFRFATNSGFKGPFAFSSDSFLANISIPEGMLLSVMVNCSDLSSASSWRDTLTKLFPRKSEESPVDMVRIACHYRDLDVAVDAGNWLSERGYIVGLNLMQIADRSVSEIEQFALKAMSSKVDVVYIADSTGSLSRADIGAVMKVLTKSCSKPIGIHAHDNLGLALSNTISALNSGATWLDATVTGMGRGPGNCKLEELIIELEEAKLKSPNYLRLLNLIETYFNPLKLRCRWGTNSFYFMAGKAGIHPTYVQQMLADPSFSTEDLLATMDYLKEKNSSTYDSTLLGGAKTFYSEPSLAPAFPFQIFKRRDVLVVGKGPKGRNHQNALEEFIRRNNVVVVALNSDVIVSSEYVDYHIACHPVRLLADASLHHEQKWKLICPFSQLPARIQSKLDEEKVIDIGIEVKNEKFESRDNGCVVPNSLVLSYALAAIATGSANKIYLGGLDGYPPGDSRNILVEHTLKLFKNCFSNYNPIALTPTAYIECERSSVYAV